VYVLRFSNSRFRVRGLGFRIEGSNFRDSSFEMMYYHMVNASVFRGV